MRIPFGIFKITQRWGELEKIRNERISEMLRHLGMVVCCSP